MTLPLDPPAAFAGLRKIPDEPAARILARAGAALETPVEAPASAPVAAVLGELSRRGALIDMLRLLAHALPAREATWWACLSARDLVPAGRAGPPETLRAAEAWVLRPGEETRARARAAFEAARNEDDAALCAMAASMADGTLGPGDLDEHPAPPGAVGGAALGLALLALYAREDGVEARGARLLARALDIARGGSGRDPEEVPGSGPQGDPQGDPAGDPAAGPKNVVAAAAGSPDGVGPAGEALRAGAGSGPAARRAEGAT